jgi:hypothetical protein
MESGGMTKLILLNGPPRSGKNTLASILQAGLTQPAEIIGISHHLKRMVHAIYLGAGGWDLDPDAFDAVKDVPQAILDGKSWRQMYIHYSENVIKPLHGKEWFGKQFMQAARKHPLVLVPDSGFPQEAEYAIREIGPENVLLLRLYRDGYTFAGDSRNYISLKQHGVVEHDLTNTDLVTLQAAALFITTPWLAG